ncbi:MAG: FKBP-type peptidyl-prolyl cis-trans isomerase [Acidimicrobiales bacterium]
MEDLKPGSGKTVTPGANVTVNYIGVSCSTGMIFDASYGRGKPLTSPLSQLIPGWQQGIPGMKVGGQRLLGIPPAQGYGARGSGSKIAPDETLWFVVEVLAAP